MDERLSHALCLLSYISRIEWTIRSCDKRMDNNDKQIEELNHNTQAMRRKKADAIRDLSDANAALEELVKRVRHGAVDSQKEFVSMTFLKKVANASDHERDDAAEEYRGSEVVNLYHFTKE